MSVRFQASMRRFTVCVTLLVCISFGLGCCASAQQPSPTSIVGRWRSLETSNGGIGALIEFRLDGTVDLGLGAVVEMPWHIERKQLILPPATTDGPEQKYTLNWLGDNKLGLETEGVVIELARVGERPAPSDPILGEWIENREMGGHKLKAHWFINNGGKLLFLMPFAFRRASYTISGSELHIIIPGPKPESRFESFDLSPNLLILSQPNGGHKDSYARY